MEGTDGRDNFIGSSDYDGTIPLEWRNRAAKLAEWAWDHLVNRTDVWIAYMPLHLRNKEISDGKKLPEKTYTAPPENKRGVARLTKAVLARHFAGRDEGDVVGIHAISELETCRWIGIDLDNHGAGNPDANLEAAIFFYHRLLGIGFTPLLYTSDGKGGFHIRVIFSAPVACAGAHYFARWVVRDYADRGLEDEPEVFPKQIGLAGLKYGSGMRLPGRHHTTEYFSEVFDGTQHWLSGAKAIEVLLSATGDSPDLIPADASPPRPHPMPARVFAPSDLGESDRVARCRRYISKMPSSISGQNGHAAFFSAACMCLRFGLSDASSIGILNEYNLRADPPWTEREIAHKLADAHKIVGADFGNMLTNGIAEVADEGKYLGLIPSKPKKKR